MSYKENTVAKVIKIIAIIEGIIGVICGFYSIDHLNFDEWGFAIMIISVVSAVLVYGIGEIIQKLENIDNNTRKSTTVANDEIPKL